MGGERGCPGCPGCDPTKNRDNNKTNNKQQQEEEADQTGATGMADPRLVGSPAASSSYPYDTHYGAASLAGPSGLRPGDDGEPEFAEEPVSLAPDTPNVRTTPRECEMGDG